MAEAEIGLVGLGVMGANLALNIAEKGFRIAVFNRTVDKTHEFVANAGELASNIVGCETPQALIAAIRPPRPVIVMVKAGEAVDEQIAHLQPLMAAGDILIDAGNANFHDTVRRFSELEGSGLRFVGMGVSGGEEGARHGPSIMAGADEDTYARIAPVLNAIAAQYEGEPCAARVGPGGAGHFVKTIHNGIEYGDMQMIAEIYALLRDGCGYVPSEMAEVFARWNEGRLNSYLIEITAKVLAAADPATGQAMVDVILDSAGQKGTGRWAAIEAQHLGVAATTIEAAVAARSLSSLVEERAAAEAAYGGNVDASPFLDIPDRGATFESALYAGKIAAYAQGFAVMQAASQEHGWNLDLAQIARIWRAGCIIRSRFLDDIARAFGEGEMLANLLLEPAFVEWMKLSAPSLRSVVAAAAHAGIATPALSAALSYFESYRKARGSANLIQAQRDFFGAHGFRRIDRPGDGLHGPWGGGA